MRTSKITGKSLCYCSVKGLVLQSYFPLFPLIHVALSIAMSAWMYGRSTIIFEVFIVSENEKEQTCPVTLLQTYPELPLQAYGSNVNYLLFCKGVTRAYANTQHFLYYQ